VLDGQAMFKMFEMFNIFLITIIVDKYKTLVAKQVKCRHLTRRAVLFIQGRARKGANKEHFRTNNLTKW